MTVVSQEASDCEAARASSVPSQWFATQFPGGASRLAALLLAQILQVASLVAPCDPGATPGTYATIHWDGDTSRTTIEPLRRSFIFED
jgi:hypothetical protein